MRTKIYLRRFAIMAIQKLDVSTGRFTYGYPGAEFPNLDSALQMARHKYRQAKEEYGDELLEDFDKALKEEEYSVYLKLTRIVKE